MPYAVPAWSLDRPEARPAEPLPPRRALRGLERAQAALGGPDDLDLIVAELEGVIPAEALARAAEALAVRHPVLRQRIEHDPTVGWSARDTGGQRPAVEAAIGGRDEILSRVLQTPFAPDGPSWRLGTVRGPDGTLVWLGAHHALVDGRSLSVLLVELLTAVADPDALGDPLDPPPPALQLARLPTWATLAAPALRRVYAARTRWVQRRSPLPAPAHAGELVTRFASRTLADDVVTRLRDEARDRRATVSGAVIAAAWAATRDLGARRGLGALGAKASVEAMVDLRPLLPGAPDVGMYAGGVLALAGEQHPDPWGLAAIATRQLHRQVSLGAPLLAHAAFDDVPDAAAWLSARGVDLDENGGAGAVTQVSNVGPWTGPTTIGGVRVRAAWSATRAVRTGPALLVWLRTVDGVGCLSAIGNGAAVTQAQLDGWLADVARRLDRMAEP